MAGGNKSCVTFSHSVISHWSYAHEEEPHPILKRTSTVNNSFLCLFLGDIFNISIEAAVGAPHPLPLLWFFHRLCLYLAALHMCCLAFTSIPGCVRYMRVSGCMCESHAKSAWVSICLWELACVPLWWGWQLKFSVHCFCSRALGRMCEAHQRLPVSLANDQVPPLHVPLASL